jgi:adenylate cyclase
MNLTQSQANTPSNSLSKNTLLGLIVIGVTLLALGFERTTPARFIDSLTYDLRMAIAAPPPRDDVVIVKIDDRAIEEMRSQSACGCISPIDKIWLADIMSTLSAYGAKAVGVDYLFDTWRSDDEFTQATALLSNLESPIIVVADPALEPGVDYPLVDALTYADARALVKDDYDDIVRRYDAHPGRVPSFAQALLDAAPPASERASTPGASTPSEKMFRLRFRAPHAGAQGENTGALAPAFSAADVAFLPAAFFKDKWVLIGRVSRSVGADAETLGEDLHMTPLHYLAGHYDGTPGVEVHAHALMQLADGDRVVVPGTLMAALITLLAALGGAAFGRSSFNWARALRWLTGSLVVFSLVSWGLFAGQGIMIGMMGPFTAFGLGFFVVSRVTTTQLIDERKLYATALERYLAPQVIRRIEDGSEPVQIGANSREITAMVSDIENFSTLVAQTPVDQFAAIINGYFDGLYDVLWKHEAMLDKLTGDGVIVLFGAPIESADHADRAIACARDMRDYTERYRQQILERFGIRMGRTRVGIHTGDALVGNFGGEKRFNYTAYGQTVVIAARLEAANKEFDTSILMSDATRQRASTLTGLREVGRLSLKGVPEPVPAFTVD